MIYILNTLHQNDGEDTIYKGFDTYSDSIMPLPEHILKDALLNNKLTVINASVQNGDIVVKDWGRGISIGRERAKGAGVTPEYSGPKYMLLAVEESKYKMADYIGYTYRYNEDELEKLVRRGEVANCHYISSTNGPSLKPIDIYEIQQDEEFEQLILDKYNIFIAKTVMLGYGDISFDYAIENHVVSLKKYKGSSDVSFDYAIENHVVRLKKYKGSSDNVILPSFITAISKEAFYWKGIQSIKLNEGLKSIGAMAFGSDGLSNHAGIEQIEIPSTVEIIGVGAFTGNKKLLKKAVMRNGELLKGGTYINREKFKILNEKTVIL